MNRRRIPRRAILEARYPGREPGQELDGRGYGALQADHGRLFPAGAEYPADAVRRLRAERVARELAGADPVHDWAEPQGTQLAGSPQDAPGGPATPAPGPEAP